MSLEGMADKGVRRLKAKAPEMASNYEARPTDPDKWRRNWLRAIQR